MKLFVLPTLQFFTFI